MAGLKAATLDDTNFVVQGFDKAERDFVFGGAVRGDSVPPLRELLSKEVRRVPWFIRGQQGRKRRALGRRQIFAMG